MTSKRLSCQNPLAVYCSIKIMLSLRMWRSILPSHTNTHVCVSVVACVWNLEFWLNPQNDAENKHRWQVHNYHMWHSILPSHTNMLERVCVSVSVVVVCVYSFMNRCYNCAGRRDAKEKMPSRVNTRWHGKNNMIWENDHQRSWW
jgi:hypothetical protein